jgi:parallel beta-helix repeat protein
MKRAVLTLILILALLFLAEVGTLASLAKANFVTIPSPPVPSAYIRFDGTVEPQTLSIQRIGDVYKFTGNIEDCTLEIQRSDIVIDGAGFSLQGNGTGRGIALINANNIQVKNIDLRNFSSAIHIEVSSNNTFTGNTIANSVFGVYLVSSLNTNLTGNKITRNTVAIGSHNSNHTYIAENQITENSNGIDLSFEEHNFIVKNNITSYSGSGIEGSFLSNCSIIENNIENGEVGILLSGSHCQQISIAKNTIMNNKVGIYLDMGTQYHSIFKNTIANNEYGVNIFLSNSSMFYYNNLIDNQKQVNTGIIQIGGRIVEGPPIPPPTFNFWNNDSKGNYWSNYNGADTNQDGIGDSSYIIDAESIDRYPLMYPFDTENNTVVLPSHKLPQTDPFKTTLTAATVATVAVISAALLVYFKKRKHEAGQT